MLLITGTIRLPAGNLDRARPAMAAMVRASRAEDGCLGYSYAEDIVEPGLIRITELWRDSEALDRHFRSAHIECWRAAWPRLNIGGRDLSVYEVSAPRPV